MEDFYGPDLALVHAEGFEALAASAAETLLAYLEQEELRTCGFRAKELPGYDGATMPPSLHACLAIKPG